MVTIDSPRVSVPAVSSTLTRWVKRSLILLALAAPMMMLSSAAAQTGKKETKSGKAKILASANGEFCFLMNTANVPGNSNFSKDIALEVDRVGSTQVISEQRLLTLTFTKIGSPSTQYHYYAYFQYGTNLTYPAYINLTITGAIPAAGVYKPTLSATVRFDDGTEDLKQCIKFVKPTGRKGGVKLPVYP